LDEAAEPQGDCGEQKEDTGGFHERHLIAKMNCFSVRQLAGRPVAAGVAPGRKCLSLVVRANSPREAQKVVESAVR
jgi:hypothetical protein